MIINRVKNLILKLIKLLKIETLKQNSKTDFRKSKSSRIFNLNKIFQHANIPKNLIKRNKKHKIINLTFPKINLKK
jgi:hypothetical protein